MITSARLAARADSALDPDAGAGEVSLPLVIAVDIGTTHCRAQVFDRLLQPLPGFYVTQPQPVVVQSDRAEIDPEAALLVLVDVLEQLLARFNPALSPERLPIVAVGVSALWHSLVGVDRDGYPVTPCLLWPDRRSSPQAERLRRQLDPDEYHRRTGAFFHPSFSAPQILWWRENAPDRFRQVARWLTLAEYFYLRLFGRTATSFSLASGTGLLDQETLGWYEPFLARIGVYPEQLSPIGEVDSVMSGLRSPFAEHLSRLAGTPFLLPAGDGACDNLGAHALNPRRWALMVGTSAALRAIVPARALSTPPAPPAPGTAPRSGPELGAGPGGHGPRAGSNAEPSAGPSRPYLPNLFFYRLLRDQLVVGGALSTGGNLIEWLRRTLLLPGDPELLQEELASLASTAPAAHGLHVVPDWGGRRSPDWPTHSPGGIISGLTLSTRPIEILQACLEGVGYRLAVVYEQLQKELREQLLNPAIISATTPVATAAGTPATATAAAATAASPATAITAAAGTATAAPLAPALVATGGALARWPVWGQILADLLGVPITVAGSSETALRGAARLALWASGNLRDLFGEQELPPPAGTTFTPDPARHRAYRSKVQDTASLRR